MRILLDECVDQRLRLPVEVRDQRHIETVSDNARPAKRC